MTAKVPKIGPKTLRDDFAMAFMRNRAPAVDETWDDFARLAYRVADAMLEARSNPKGETNVPTSRPQAKQ